MELHEGLSEPVRKAWERSLTQGRAALTRRSLLRAAGLGALAAGTLTACGIPAAQGNTGASSGTEDDSAKEKVVNFANWPLYIDVDEKDKGRRPTLDAFTKATGIQVKYTEGINDNVEFFGKIRPQLAAGQNTGYDLMILTDWMAARIIRLGWAEKLDPSRLPHAFANLEQRFRSPDWDPGRGYSYPWAGVTTMIAYNRKATGGKPVTSVTQLLTDPSLKGRVTFLSEMRDSIGLTLLDMGKRPESFTTDDFDAALARLQKGADSGQIRRFTGNDYGDELAKGDIAACAAWGGDLVQMRIDNPDIEYVIPEAGYITSTDNMMVPRKSRHLRNAEALIDWYYQPKIAAELAAGITFVPPVIGTKEELEKIDKEAAANPLIVPDQNMVTKGHPFRALSEAEETAYEAKFAKLIGA
ncbi:polyamine ABC transporter substrate-binding protein [Peterkaempfera bronchialis]|uniref:Spermidine/putrescine ABC transporter substrate-binding protein n=1 Tax=Peterkaempfera bronchialis TaxID=2126346 RepID=A0A345T0Y7_9ACTN|nr:spermidine/putrescine ABC transporter substrate-binding protein [Peterkaempfera bronchialis]AXI79642.1 spermidine/putrescine ABC transporter substrate-binding protein [Peterkaempfera bronchialis]